MNRSSLYLFVVAPVVGLSESNVVSAANIDQGIPVSAARAKEEASSEINLGTHGGKHGQEPAFSALPHDEPPLSAATQRIVVTDAAIDHLREALSSLEVAANTAEYCYSRPIAQGRFAESMARLKESAASARAVLASTGGAA